MPSDASRASTRDATEIDALVTDRYLESLLAARAPLYAEVAEARVPTDGLDPGQVAARVLSALGRVPGPAG